MANRLFLKSDKRKNNRLKTRLNLRLRALTTLFVMFVFSSNSYAINSFLKEVWSPYFKTFTVDDGLSLSAPRVVIQDHQEFIWVVTTVGVDRFNGYEFETISFAPSKIRKPHLQITGLLIDNRQQVVAVSRSGGVFVYNPEIHQFETKFVPQKQLRVSTAQFDSSGLLYLFDVNQVLQLELEPNKQPTATVVNELSHLKNSFSSTKDIDGVIWVGTSDGQLHSYQPQVKRAKSHPLNRQVLNDINDRVMVTERAGGGVHAAARAGEIYTIQNQDSHVEQLPKLKHIYQQPSNILAILETSDNFFWIATRGEGLFRVSLNDLSSKQYKRRSGLHGSLSSNNLYLLFLDQQGLLWVGAANGLNYAQIENNRFYQIGGNNAYSLPLTSLYASAIYQQDDGKLWIGSNDAGYNIITKTQIPNKPIKLPFVDLRINFQHLVESKVNPSSVTSIAESIDNTIWIGSFDGLSWVDSDGNEKQVSEAWREVSSSGVNAMLIDAQQKMLIGFDNYFTFQSGDGELFRYHIESPAEIYRRFEITGPYNNRYWFASEKSPFVYEFDSTNETINVIKPLTDDGYEVTGVTALWVTPDGYLWMATESDGVARHKLDSKEWRWFDAVEQLSQNDFYGIIGDAKNNIWITGNKGLTRWDSTTKKFHNFSVVDGLQSNEFNHQAIFRSQQGMLFFGGINGVTVVDENNFSLNKHIPKTYIQAAFLFTSDGLKRLNRVNDHIEELDYRSNSLSFKIGANDFLNPQMNSYAYRLIGQNKDWLDIGSNRDITLLNLAPGNYQLQVTSCNKENTCNLAPAALSFSIPAPPWLSYWAYLLYSLVLLSFIFYVLKKQRDKLAYQSEIARQEKVIADELRELNILKDEFLTNTSHELRTPLNGIIGLSEMLMNEPDIYTDEEIEENIRAIHNSGSQLASLVEDLLDFSQLQRHRLTINRKVFNISEMVEDVVLLFSPQALDKGLNLQGVVQEKEFKVFADENRVRQVLHNLVNNAIKFSDKGSIKIILIRQEHQIRVSVLDEGIGIPQDQQNKIFFSFTQVNGSSTRNQGGIGLGLAISKDIIELHGSELEIRSNSGLGAEFSFKLAAAKPEVAAW